MSKINRQVTGVEACEYQNHKHGVITSNSYKFLVHSELGTRIIGSGATLNETARKIRERKICKGKIIGLAIVGSFKGFDVISEV